MTKMLFLGGAGILFLYATTSNLSLGPTQPFVQWVPEALTPGEKGLECEADHSLPSMTEVTNVWIYTSIPSYNFVA
jgi:hypothetical protein